MTIIEEVIKICSAGRLSCAFHHATLIFLDLKTRGLAMKRMNAIIFSLMIASISLGCVSVPEGRAGQPLALTDISALHGTSWQLVRLEGGDGQVLEVSDRSRYTLAFKDDGKIAATIFCNRGVGTYTSSGLSKISFGLMALTRAFCMPDDPIENRITEDWASISSFAIKNGNLALTVMNDGGVYIFEPMSTR